VLCSLRNRGSAVTVVTELCSARPGFHFREGQGYSHVAPASRPALGPSQTPTKWVSMALYSQDKASEM
jgi:hypothetical protein